jgi:hypothetical protein
MTVRSLLTGRLDDQAGGLPDGALGLLGRAATTQWVSPNVAGLASPGQSLSCCSRGLYCDPNGSSELFPIDNPRPYKVFYTLTCSPETLT